MWYAIVSVIIIIPALVWGFQNRSQKADESNSLSSEEINSPRDTIKKFLTKAKIEKKLKVLAEAPVPKNLESRGAMCYEMAAPPKHAEYICPVCGTKTLYTDYMAPFIQHDLLSCRSGVNSLKGIDATLDESYFCKKCASEKDNPQLCLIIRYSDDKEPHKTCPVYPEDFVLLREFLGDSLKHHGDFDIESPLVNHIERIRILLGTEKIKNQKP